MAASLRRFVCRACGVLYDEALGDPDGGIAAGTRFEDIPDDWRCPVCGVGKADFELVVPRDLAPRAAATAPLARGAGIVIVGAGTAGWAVAKALRARDARVPVTLVSACEADAYHKPLLSVSASKGREARSLVEATGPRRADELAVRLVNRAVALRLDTTRRRLVTTRGTLRYRDLVIATGSRPKRLSLAGDAAGEVMTLNDLPGYARLQAALAAGARRFVVIGAGLVGCEIAADLAKAGRAVTLVDVAPAALAAQLPGAAALALSEKLSALGIACRFGVRARSLEHGEGALRLVLEEGAPVGCDAVVVAVGLDVDLRIARRAGLATGEGIVADARTLVTSDPHVYAVGECASIEGRRYGYIEPILEQAEACAAALAGESAPFVPRPPLVRLKVAAFPLAWSASGEGGEWRLAESAADGFVYARESGGVLSGIVAGGSLADGAARLRARLPA